MPCDIQTTLSLVEGVDYQLDPANGSIKFLSTGQLGPLMDSELFCGITLEVCCQDQSCDPYNDPYACDYACYVHDGYSTVMQTGAEDFKNDDDKMCKMLGLEAEPAASSTPLDLQMDVGFGVHQNCLTWKAARRLPFECQTAKTPAQHLADRTRPDVTFYYPVWRRGRYIGARFRIDGVGGAGKFSQLDRQIQGWGEQDNP